MLSSLPDALQAAAGDADILMKRGSPKRQAVLGHHWIPADGAEHRSVILKQLQRTGVDQESQA